MDTGTIIALSVATLLVTIVVVVICLAYISIIMGYTAPILPPVTPRLPPVTLRLISKDEQRSEKRSGNILKATGNMWTKIPHEKFNKMTNVEKQHAFNAFYTNRALESGKQSFYKLTPGEIQQAFKELYTKRALESGKQSRSRK
jgi:hypothetical protein